MVGLNSKSVLGPLRRVVATAQNGLEVVRLGGLETDLTTSPFEIVERAPMYRLRRYFPDTDPAEVGPPIVLIPPMMMSAGVYDVTRDQGAVGILHEMGLDPWVVDFGEPDAQDGGWGRNLADHIIALSEVVDHVIGTRAKTFTCRDIRRAECSLTKLRHTVRAEISPVSSLSEARSTRLRRSRSVFRRG
jgi:putative long chain acyl-CoA synthase